LEFWIPYGNTEVPLRVPDDNFYKILEPPKPEHRDPSKLVSEALANSLGGLTLSDIPKQGGKAGIVVDPMIPPVFIQSALEALKVQLENINVNNIIVFLRKRPPGTIQLEGVTEGAIQVNPSDGTFTEIGKTNSGTPVQLRNEFLDCSVKVGLGLVTPHFATGWTGGPDAILPGVSSGQTVIRNRSLILRGDATRGAGSWGPVFDDSLEACKLAGPVYSVSFVPDGRGSVEAIFAGEVEATIKEAASRYVQIHSPRIDRKPDIAILPAGGVLGVDLYHSVRILSNAWDIVRKDGTIILVAECSKGIGDQTFQDFSRKFEDRKALGTELRHHFHLGAHVALFLKEALERNRVQLVSILPDHYSRMFNLKSAKTASAAIQSSIRAEGKDSKILIVTRGDLTLPIVQTGSLEPSSKTLIETKALA
jgi:lactate racemase